MTPAHPPRWRGWLVACAIFLLGLAVGGTGTVVIGLHLFRQAIRNGPENRPLADRAAARIGADLTEALQLTPAEAERVQTLLNESAANLKAVRVQATTQAAAELRASTEKIAATLPPEKRPEFHRIIQRRFERLGLPAPGPGAPR